VRYFSDGNLLSVLAFFIWIPVTYYGVWRWPPAKATATLFLGGLLLLPEKVFFKPPGLPDFSKLEIIPFWILIWVAVFHRERFASAPKSRWFRISVVVLLVGSIVTVFLNTDGYRIGSTDFPGHVPYDAVHAVLVSLLTVVLPFYLGAIMFRSSGELRVLLVSVVMASLLYTPLQYLEMLLSPQLHRWVYGFHQHAFIQVIRDGGYRPMVFMKHGLAVALFTVLAVIAAAGLYRGKVSIGRFRGSWTALYLFVTLSLSRSLASLLYGFMALPLVLLTSPRFQAKVAAALVALLLFYPIARANDLVPVDALEAWVEENYGLERARSMTFRFNNEEPQLDRAMERAWFGWGSYCRACVYKEYSEGGAPETVRDGAWIIRLGDHGIVGFVAAFSLLFFPVFALARRMKYVYRASNRRLLAVLGLMVGFCALDLIPNGDFSRLAFVLSGALWGCLTGILHESSTVRLMRRRARLASAMEARA